MTDSSPITVRALGNAAAVVGSVARFRIGNLMVVGSLFPSDSDVKFVIKILFKVESVLVGTGPDVAGVMTPSESA